MFTTVRVVVYRRPGTMLSDQHRDLIKESVRQFGPFLPFASGYSDFSFRFPEPAQGDELARRNNLIICVRLPRRYESETEPLIDIDTPQKLALEVAGGLSTLMTPGIPTYKVGAEIILANTWWGTSADD